MSRSAKDITPGSTSLPDIVCVLPELVCPYAMTVPLIPRSTALTTGFAAALYTLALPSPSPKTASASHAGAAAPSGSWYRGCSTTLLPSIARNTATSGCLPSSPLSSLALRGRMRTATKMRPRASASSELPGFAALDRFLPGDGSLVSAARLPHRAGDRRFIMVVGSERATSIGALLRYSPSPQIQRPRTSPTRRFARVVDGGASASAFNRSKRAISTTRGRPRGSGRLSMASRHEFRDPLTISRKRSLAQLLDQIATCSLRFFS